VDQERHWMGGRAVRQAQLGVLVAVLAVGVQGRLHRVKHVT
jgi:hypothetical protein